MSDSDGLEEIVLLFNEDGTAVVSEMRYAEFEAVINQAATLDEFAASQVKSAYGVVGTGLALRGLVLFLIRVDENGAVDAGFNLPLRYLIRNAGLGPDLGSGAIRMASRAQCPVPWHSLNMWEPPEDAAPDEHPAHLVQRAVWRNRLKLRPTSRAITTDPPATPPQPIHSIEHLEDADEGPERQSAAAQQSPAPQRTMEARLTEAFGEEGKVSLEQLIRQYNSQVNDVAERYRRDVQQQQQAYLDQLRTARDEIQKLKSSLRQEQERSRRLQSLLRGEP